MSILDALQRGWWRGVSAWPEYVGGAVGLLGDITPGEDDIFARQSRIIKEFGSDLAKSKAPKGESEGILEKIVEGLGAAPVDLTTYIPAGIAGKALKLKGLAKPAFTFGATSAVRAGGEGLPTVIGEGLRGGIEGAAFGMAGKWAGKYGVGPEAQRLIDKQKSLILQGDKEAARALQPEISRLVDTTKNQLMRRGRHAAGAGGIGAGLGVLHGDPVEDVAASAGVMGILGAVQSGRYKRPTAKKEENVRLVAEEIRAEAAKRGEQITKEQATRQAEKVVKEAEQTPVEPIAEGEGPSITLTDFKQAGIESRAYTELTDASKSRYGGHKKFLNKLQENYRALTDERVLREIETDPDLIKLGKILTTDYEGNATVSLSKLPMIGAKIKSIMNAKDKSIAEIKQMEAFERKRGNHAQADALLEEMSKVQQQADGAALLARGIDSEVGRALQKAGILDKESPEWRKAVKDLEKRGIFEKDGSGQYRKDIRELMQLSEGMPDLQMKLMKALNTPTLFDKIQEYWINGLLSGPPTHAVNTLSNSLTGAIDVLEKRWGTRAEVGKDVKLGKEVAKLTKDQAILENATDLRVTMNALPKAFKLAGLMLMRGENWEPGAKWKFAERYAGGQERIDYRSKAISGPKGKVIRYPTLALRALDMTGKIIAGERYGTQKALRMAWEDATMTKLPKGRTKIPQTKEAIVERAEQYLGNKVGEIGGLDPHPAVLKAMQKEGRRLTYTQEPDEILRTLQRARDVSVNIPGVGEVKPLVGVVPFTSTPYRVIRHAVARSPLGLLRLGDLKQKYEKGEISSNEYYREVTGTALGTTMTVALGGLASAGFITGGGPENYAERANLLSQGWRPYSVKIPGVGYMPLQRIEPLGTVMGLAADAVEYLETDDEDRAGKAIAMVKDNITNKSFLQGMEMFAAAMANPEQFGPMWYRQMAGSVVPTGVAKVAQAIDPYSRVVEPFGSRLGVADPIAARIPGMTQALPVRKTPFGEEAQRWGTYDTSGIGSLALSGVQSFLSPVPLSKERAGKEVEKELTRLSNYSGIPPSTPKREKTMVLRGLQGERVKLTDAEYKVFDRYHQMAKKQMENVIASPMYQRMPDDAKAKLLSSVYRKFRSAAHKEINARIRRRSIG